MSVDQAALVNAEPNAAETLPSNKRKWRPTSDFPADPSDLSREMLVLEQRSGAVAPPPH